jgi:SLT domain-containing protein
MVNAGAVDHLRGRLPGFASGGIVPSYHGNLPGLNTWTDNNYNATVNSFASSMAGSLKSAMAKAAAAAAASGGIGGGVQQWASLILKVLAMLGQPSTDLGVVLSQMQTESGGNPRAINLTDSNAAMGDPSRGLMQVIGSTFARYRSWMLPNDIYNPEANIFAGLNYALNRYGLGWASVLGHGHGYGNGTNSAAPGWAMVGEHGPELLRMHGGEQVVPNGAFGDDGDIVINIDGKQVFKVTQKHARRYNRRNGGRGSNKAWNAA